VTSGFVLSTVSKIYDSRVDIFKFIANPNNIEGNTLTRTETALTALRKGFASGSPIDQNLLPFPLNQTFSYTNS
jgi:hypothetical protein